MQTSILGKVSAELNFGNLHLEGWTMWSWAEARVLGMAHTSTPGLPGCSLYC